MIYGPIIPKMSDEVGVWSDSVEEAFQEALAIYPPCGRRKMILTNEGKLYGNKKIFFFYDNFQNVNQCSYCRKK